MSGLVRGQKGAILQTNLLEMASRPPIRCDHQGSPCSDCCALYPQLATQSPQTRPAPPTTEVNPTMIHVASQHPSSGSIAGPSVYQIAGAVTRRPTTRHVRHEVDSDEEDTGVDNAPRERHVQALSKTPAVAKTLETPKPQAAAQQRHNEIIGLLSVLTAKLDGLQEQLRIVQTDVKILKESAGKTGSVGPTAGVYVRPHY